MNLNYEKQIVLEPVGMFRAMARDGFRGRVSAALLLGFVYGLALNVPQALLNVFSGLELMRMQLVEAGGYSLFLEGFSSGEPVPLMTNYTTLTNLVNLLIMFFTGPLALGFAACCLRFRRGQPCGIGILFSGFGNFWRAVGLIFLQTLFIALWALLLIVPGIIAAYRYRFAFFILSDNPGIGPLEALRASKYLTDGNKAKIFLLDLSFIGWFCLLGVLVWGISAAVLAGLGTALPWDTQVYMATLIMSPIGGVLGGFIGVYVQSAQAAFYDCASGQMPPTRLAPPPLY